MNVTQDPTSVHPAVVAFDNMTTAMSATNNTEQEDPDAYLYKLGTDLFIVIDILLVGGGCLGNILVFIVSTRKGLQSSSVSVFLAALAIADTLVLVLDFINNWLTLELDIYLLGSPVFCLFHRWFFNVCYTTSAWLIAGVAFERFIAVNFPLKARVWCTTQRALITIICIPLIIGILYLYNFWTWTVKGDNAKCRPRAVHEWFMGDVSPWLTATLYSYIPIIVVVVSNATIVSKLSRAKFKRDRMTGDSSADSAAHRKVTVTVCVISLAYIITTLPLSVWYIYAFSTRHFIEQGPREVFTEICILILGLANHAINFFLYVMMSEQFRSELRSIFYCASVCKSPRSQRYVSSATTKPQARTSGLAVVGRSSGSQVVDNQPQEIA